jgi:RDD family
MTDDTAAQAGREPIEGANHSLAYADASSRLVAYLIDGVLVGVAIFIVAFVMSRLLGPTQIARTDGLRPVVDQGRALVNAVMATTISGAYFVGCWLAFRATVGQRLLGMVVVQESDVARLRPGQAVVRWFLLGAWWGVLGALLLSISLAAWVLAFAIVVWDLVLLWTTARDGRKRGLHDRAAGSVVHRRVRLVSSEA